MTPPKKPSPPSQSSTSATPPPGPSSNGPLDRARVEDMGRRLKRDPLPLLYLLGFVILAGTVAYLYNHPATPPEAQQAAVRVDGLQEQVQTLTDRLAKLEARPAGAGAAAAADLALLDRRTAALENRPAPPAVNLAPLEGRIAAIEGRPAPPPVNLQPLEARIAALEGKPPPPAFDPAPLTSRLDALAAAGTAATGALGGRLDALASKEAADAAAVSGRLDALAAKQAADAAAVTGRLDSVAAKQGADTAALGGRLDALDSRIAAVDGQAKQTASQVGAVAERSGRVVRLQAAMAALESGQPLGDIPGAPPAVTRFAATPPKTEQELRRSFDAAAEAAEQAGQPAIMENKSFGDRLFARAQQAVTVRQGDRVLVGDPLAGRIIRARAALDAGDLAGAVKALDGLAGPAQAAMADWIGQARALLEARAALSSMAARS